jgi:head-tail adaptor
MVIEIGMLDRVVVIQQATEIQGGNGEINQTWNDLVTLRVAKMDRNAVEKYLGDEKSAINKTNFIIHYRSAMRAGSFRLKDENNDIFEIQGVKELESKNEFPRKMWMVLNCENIES